MKLKSIISLIITSALLTCILNLPLSVQADETDFIIENGVLKNYSGIGGEITIPDRVTSIDTKAFEGSYPKSKVIVPKTVISIGEDAFIHFKEIEIYCETDSYAEVYAINNGISYVLNPGIMKISGTNTVIDRQRCYIYGLDKSAALLDGAIEAIGGATFKVRKSVGQMCGTGTEVDVIYNEKNIKTYEVIYFGDVNGDGNIDAVDADICVDLQNWIISWNHQTQGYYYKAGDVNGDGNVDALDADVMMEVANWRMYIDQNTGLGVNISDVGIRFKQIVDEAADYLEPCQRLGDAAGLSTTDFDFIYPYDRIKLCNIKVQPYGRNKITYQGEKGFALDGSNGNVFVEIPKHYVKRFVSDGYEYRYISSVLKDGFIIDPAFIENGEELNAVYVSAYEGYIDNGKLLSVTGVYPSANYTRPQFRTFAKANGAGYGILDIRTLNMLQNLFVIEFASLNSQTAIGGGWGMMYQPSISRFRAVVNEINTNRIIISDWNYYYNNYLFVGSAIQCVKYSSPATVLMTGHTITSIEVNTPITGQTSIYFDGPPVDITTDFVLGSSAQKCGWADTVIMATGRTPNHGTDPEAAYRNAVRFRYMENLWGNLWCWIDGINLLNGKAYYTENMDDYESEKTVSPYIAVSESQELQNSNASVGVDSEINYIKNLTFDAMNPMLALPKDYVNQGVTSIPADQTAPRLGSNALRVYHFGDYYYLNTSATCYCYGGGFDHYWRCGLFTMRGWGKDTSASYLIGARLIYKPMAYL